IDYSLRGSQLWLRTNADFLQERLKKIVNWLTIEVPVSLALESIPDWNRRITRLETWNDPEVIEARNDHLMTIARRWADREKQDPASYLAAVKGLWRRTRGRDIDRILAVMAADPATDLKHYEYIDRDYMPARV